MKCDYCSIFNTATIRTRTERYCTVLHRNVAREDEKCERFVPYHITWCPKKGYQIDVIACIARQNREAEECYPCSQGQRIKHIDRLQKKKEAQQEQLPPPVIANEQVKRRLSRVMST